MDTAGFFLRIHRQFITEKDIGKIIQAPYLNTVCGNNTPQEV
jgi:hypothetical protein